ncbi:MAG: phosphoribosylamine--glycine ligase, partial [Opitutales bacterium TMED158]
LETDPIAIMLAAAKGELSSIDVKVKDDYAMVVVLASKGYPGSYPKGEAISFPESVGENEWIIHAGTKAGPGGEVLTNGGRVLGITALGADLQEASDKAYALTERVDFPSKYLRRDIGGKELNRAR